MTPKIDKELWADAEDRAARAKSYASKFPDQIRPSELMFQNVQWQYDQLLKFPRKQ